MQVAEHRLEVLVFLVVAIAFGLVFEHLEQLNRILGKWQVGFALSTGRIGDFSELHQGLRAKTAEKVQEIGLGDCVCVHPGMKAALLVKTSPRGLGTAISHAYVRRQGLGLASTALSAYTNQKR